jgi:hypothetical protein
MATSARAAAIAAQNDRFRAGGALGAPGVPGRWMVTRGIAALPDAQVRVILQAVRTFDRFTPGNDPHKERDFGMFTAGDVRVLWKIDYYASAACDFGAEDARESYRVLTIMLAEEY